MLFGKALSSWALLNVCFIHNSLAATGGQSMNGHLAVPPHPPLENTDTVVLPYETPQESTEEITETTTPPRKKRKSVGWEDKQPVEHSNAPPESITHVTLPSDGPPHPGTPNVVTIQISEMDKKDGENESDHPPLVKRTSVPGDRHGREKEQKKENMEKEKQNLEKEKQNLAKEKEMFEKEMEKEKQTLEMEKQNLEKEKEILEKEKQAQILEKKKEKQNLGKELEPDSEMGVEEERADGVWNPFSGTHQPGPAPEKVVRHERVEGYHWVERYACDPFGAPAPSELPAVAEANTWTIGEVVTPYITEENSSVETAMLLETCLDSTTKRTILEEDAKSTKWKDAFQEAERHLREVGKRSVQFGINGLNGGVHYFTVTAYDKSEKLPEDLVVITDSWQNVYGMQNRRMLRKDFLQASKTIFSGEASIPDAQAAMRLLFPQYPKKAIDADHIPKLYQTITGLVNGKRLVKRRIRYDAIPCMDPILAFPYPTDPPTHSYKSIHPPTPYVPSKPEINRDRVVLRSAPRGPAVELPPPRRPAPADPIPDRCEGDTRESPQLGPSNVKKLDQQLPPSNVPAMAVSNLTWLLLVAAVLMGPGNVLG